MIYACDVGANENALMIAGLVCFVIKQMDTCKERYVCGSCMNEK